MILKKTKILFFTLLIITLKSAMSQSGWYVSEIHTVDSADDVGMYNSITWTGNQLYISYYDNTNGHLKVAIGNNGSYTLYIVDSSSNVGEYSCSVSEDSDHPNTIYYNCSNNTLKYAGWLRKWEFDIVDSSANVGEYNTILMNLSDKPTISYYDSDNENLKLATFDGSTWNKQVVDSSSSVGKYCSYTLDSIERESFIYYNETNNTLKYAGWLRKWEFDIVDSSANVGEYNTILMNLSDKPTISYYDSDNENLKLSTFNGSTWSKQVVDSSASVGKYGSYVLDPFNRENFLYFNETNNTLKYAGWLRKWEFEVVDSTTADIGQYNSIKYNDFQTHISYYDATNNDLRFATKDAYGWHLETVNDTGDVGKYTCLAISPWDTAHVIYFDDTENELEWATKMLTNPYNCEYIDVPEGHYAYDAVSYLCNEGLLDNDGYCEPDTMINRAALSKLAYLSVDLDLCPAADTFPSPFNDLQDTSVWYYSFAKNLSYLEFDNNKAPFDKEFFNFYPSNGISRAHTLKVLLEAWDVSLQTGTGLPYTDVPEDHDAYIYIYTAYQMGIIEDNPEHIFGPNVNAYRGEVFVWLYRMMSVLGMSKPSITASDFFVPGNYTPENFAAFQGMHSGNFNFYVKSSFFIPGIGLPIAFEHTYNSYLTEMPGHMSILKPLGHAWSHSYNSYISEVPGDITAPQLFRVVVVEPGGGFHVYKLTTVGNYKCITEGVYNTLSKPDSNRFVLKTKGQIEYTYEKPAGTADDFPYVLTGIEDRNGNAITITYEDAEKTNYKRINEVEGTAGRTLEFSYHSGCDLISQVSDPLGRSISFDYDSYDESDEPNLTSFTDAKSQNTTYNYGTTEAEKHLLLSIELPKGNVVTNTYEQNKLTSTKTNGNNPTQMSYQRNYGQAGTEYTQTSVTDPEGNETVIDYNQNGKPYTINSPLADIDIAYDASQTFKPTAIEVNSQSTSYSYDNRGNITEIDMPLGVTHQFQYNSFNDLTQYTNPRGKVFTNSYDGNGNLTQASTPRGTTSYSRNSNGQVSSTTNPSGITINYTYDSYGNLSNTSAPEGISSSSTFDLAGRILSFTNPLSVVTTYSYDNNDNMISYSKVGIQTQFGFDANDNMTSITNAKGISTSLNYEFQTDFLSSVSFVGNTDSYTYLEDGRLNTRMDPNGNTFTTTYDSEGRVQSVISGSETISYTYDAYNNLASVTNSNGTISFTYDALNRIIGTTDYYGKQVSYTYDATGNVTQMTYPGNKTVQYTYDDDNLLHSVTDWNSNTTTYTYRSDGLLTQTEYPNGTYCQYSYDNAGRMTGMSWKKSDASVICSYTFQLDAMGNHTSETITEPYTKFNLTAQETNYSYNNANRIISAGSTGFTFDNNGNTISKTGKTYQYNDYDLLTQLQASDNIQYGYDGLHNRRSRSVNSVVTRYVLDILGTSNVLMETSSSGVPQNYYIYGLGLISRINSSNQTSYYHYDYRGSTVAITDESESITHQYQYDAFGNILQMQEADHNPFRYVGKYGVMYEADDLYFMRARYYDPEIGRFISEDPVWSTNLYPYADNNPVIGIDPFGKFNILETGISLVSDAKSVFNPKNNIDLGKNIAFLTKDLTEIGVEMKKAGNFTTFFKNGLELKKWSLFSNVNKAGIIGTAASLGVNIYSNYKEGIGAQSIPKAFIQTGIGGLTLGFWDGEELFELSEQVGDYLGGILPQKKHKIYTEEEIRANMRKAGRR